LAYRQYPIKLGGEFAVVQSGHLVNVIRPVIELREPRRRQNRPNQLQIKTTPSTGTYRYRGRRDASSADFPTQQLVIRDVDLDDVDTTWATRVFPRDHNVEYSAELVRDGV